MSSQPEGTTSYSDQDWQVLVELPGLVAIAATSAEPDGMRRTVDEGLAGDRAIRAGLHSDSPLVRAVAARACAADSDEPRPAAVEFNDRQRGLADVVARAHRAAGLVGGGSTPHDAHAYRGWVLDIAQQVCAAARTGGFLGLGGVAVSDAERDFLADLTDALDGSAA